MLMEFPKLIEAIRAQQPEETEDLGFLAKIDRQNALRVKLLACGFAWKLSEERVQELLKKNRQQPLYSRNLWEFTLKYAFRHGLTYERWRDLHRTVTDYVSKTNGMEWDEVLFRTIEGQLGQDAALFRGGITIPAIKYYIEHNGGAVARETRAFTEELERALQMAEERDAGDEGELLGEVVRENLEKFSAPRGRARLYFLREVDRYMDWVLEQLLNRLERWDKRLLPEQAGRYFGCKTELKEKLPGLSKEELRVYLTGRNLSPKALADDFVLFYGGPFFLEPGEYLLDGVENWYNDEDKMRLVQRLARQGEDEFPVERVVRAYTEYLEDEKDLKSVHQTGVKGKKRELARGWNETSGVGTSCGEMEEEIRSEWENLLRLMQKVDKREEDYRDPRFSAVNRRKFEGCFRAMITGGMDVSREWLLLFMLFVDKGTNAIGAKRLRADRVNNVLQKCSFAPLDQEREFDRFMIKAIRDPMSREEMENWLLNIAQMEFLYADDTPLTDTFIKRPLLDHQLKVLDPERAKEERDAIEAVAEEIRPNPWKRKNGKK